MFHTKTTFIIGAGASVELGFPTGEGLKGDISRYLNTRSNDRLAFADASMHDSVLELSRDTEISAHGARIESFRSTARQMCHVLPLAPSIDNYLDAHQGNEQIESLGKLAIAASILEHESLCALKPKGLNALRLQDASERDPYSKQLLESWYINLVRLLTAGRSRDEAEDIFSGVSFVVFNYDRCLEHFLYGAIVEYYNLTAEEGAQILNRAKFIHPYGKIGNLPWQDGGTKIHFGRRQGISLLEISRQLKTFTESADSGLVEDVRETIRSSETLVFMGFGYLSQNMQLLAARDTSVRRVFATTAGFSESDVEVVLSEIEKVVGKPALTGREGAMLIGVPTFRAYIERGFCSDLMKNHVLRLSRA